MIKYCGLSEVGLHRENNQDSFITIENKYGDFLALVCDGIGGAKAGDVASGEIVKYFKKNFINSGPFNSAIEAKEYILDQLKRANREVYNLSIKYREFDGMGTTLTGIFINKFATFSINVGDSRVYGFLDNKIFRLTNDHTLVNKMLEDGEITYEESINHPQKHYLVRAVGVWKDVEYDIHEVKDMKAYLICSDGLCGYVDDDEILEIMNDNIISNIYDRCQEFINLALLKGGYDNITVVVVEQDENS